MSGKTLKETPSEKARDKVYLSLKQLIMENELKAGTSHLEEQLAAQLSVSRTPLREAALQLERDGLVEIRPRHGLIILPISTQDMREIYQIRAELESLAVALIARRGLSDEEFTSLIQSITAMEAALDATDMKAWASADDEFHRLLVCYSQNTRLKRIMVQLRDQVHRVRLATLHLRCKPVQSNTDHELLIQYLRDQDESAARKLHYLHLTRAGDFLIKLLEKSELDAL